MDAERGLLELEGHSWLLPTSALSLPERLRLVLGCWLGDSLMYFWICLSLAVKRLTISCSRRVHSFSRSNSLLRIFAYVLTETSERLDLGLGDADAMLCQGFFRFASQIVCLPVPRTSPDLLLAVVRNEYPGDRVNHDVAHDSRHTYDARANEVLADSSSKALSHKVR